MTARKLFPQISLAFFDWLDAQLILENRKTCIEIAQRSFDHRAKLSAMVDAVEFLESRGFQEVRVQLETDPIGLLSTMRYIGPITAWHLAKNLGCDVAKPDRHLVRIAEHFGYDCVHALCRELSEDFDERIAVVDLILWRFSATGTKLLEPC